MLANLAKVQSTTRNEATIHIRMLVADAIGTERTDHLIIKRRHRRKPAIVAIVAIVATLFMLHSTNSHSSAGWHAGRGGAESTRKSGPAMDGGAGDGRGLAVSLFAGILDYIMSCCVAPSGSVLRGWSLRVWIRASSFVRHVAQWSAR